MKVLNRETTEQKYRRADATLSELERVLQAALAATDHYDDGEPEDDRRPR